MNDNESYIHVEINDGIARLTLVRPPVNVVNIPMLRQLAGALAELADNGDVRVLLLQARGKLFSAGVDVADHTADKVGEMIPLFNRVCRDLAAFPLPTIAAVQGHALGGGCELVICCDLAVMAETAKIGQPEIQLAALAPIAILRLPQLVGYRATADILFSGRSLNATEAVATGLVNAAVAAGEVESWAVNKATSLAGLSRAALSLLKQALVTGCGDWSEKLPAIERLYLEELMNTADAQEGITAFMEKRPPVWQHG
jgi:cyclohexa-1,5-dienecarbonyl-CoA hydratase